MKSYIEVWLLSPVNVVLKPVMQEYELPACACMPSSLSAVYKSVSKTKYQKKKTMLVIIQVTLCNLNGLNVPNGCVTISISNSSVIESKPDFNFPKSIN